MSEFQDRMNKAIDAELVDLNLESHLKDALEKGIVEGLDADTAATIHVFLRLIGPDIFKCGFSAGALYGMDLRDELK